MIFAPFLMVPQSCPACGRGFWSNHGHGTAHAIEAATDQVDMHARYTHGRIGMRLILEGTR